MTLVGFKGIWSGIRKREIHSGCLCRTEVAVRTRFLNFVEGITEHLIVCFLAVEQEINGLAYLFALDLAVQIFIYDLGSLLGCNVGEQVGAQVTGDCDVICCPGIPLRLLKLIF